MKRQSKPITTDRLDKMRQGFDRSVAERRRWREQPLLVVQGWRIFRLDERNVVLTDRPDDEDSFRFYPGFESAATVLLRELAMAPERPGIEGLLEAIQKAETAIVNAVKEARWPSELLDRSAPAKDGAQEPVPDDTPRRERT